MRIFFFTVLMLFTLAFFGCGPDSNKSARPDLRQLIVKAIGGDTNANIELKGLLSTNHIGNKDYNQLFIDSLIVNGKYYYTVLLEYFDPSLNLFAIYDNNLKFYLMDKSLNGYLSSEWAVMNDRKFVFVQERFLTKDVLNIDRLSIYEVYDTTAALVYRSISSLVKNKNTSTQTVENITTDFIVTKITVNVHSNVINQTDTFYFNSNIGKYLSKKDLFNNFVKKEVEDFQGTISKPQIPSTISKNNSLPK